jgi:hypothetical protein
MFNCSNQNVVSIPNTSSNNVGINDNLNVDIDLGEEEVYDENYVDEEAENYMNDGEYEENVDMYNNTDTNTNHQNNDNNNNNS